MSLYFDVFLITIINMNTQNNSYKILNTFTATQPLTNITTTTQVALRDITADEFSRKSAQYMQRSKAQLMRLCQMLGFSVTTEQTKPMLIQLIMSTHMAIDVVKQ